jgi:hypothetical protein
MSYIIGLDTLHVDKFDITVARRSRHSHKQEPLPSIRDRLASAYPGKKRQMRREIQNPAHPARVDSSSGNGKWFGSRK